MRFERITIKQRINAVVMTVVILTIVLISIIVVFSLGILKRKTQQALKDKMYQNVVEITVAKAEFANVVLNECKSRVEQFAHMIGNMYKYSDEYKPKYVDKVDKSIADKYVLQRSFINDDINLDDVKDEMFLLANIVKDWEPLMEKNDSIITSLYLGTEKGFMLSYDKYSSAVTLNNNGEISFDHINRYWYIEAKAKEDTVFSDLQQDSFGKGLALTCSTPFYNNGVFAGVIGMDILVTDLQEQIIDVDLGSEDAYAFVVDNRGNIVASPNVNLNTTSFENVRNKNSIYHSISEKILDKIIGIDDLANDVVCAYAPINITNWTLCTHFPETYITKPVKNMKDLILKIDVVYFLAMIFIMFLATLLVIQVSDKLSKPIYLLKEEVDKIDYDNLDKPIKVVGNDEISDLAIAFNNMKTSLKSNIEDLKNVTAEKERIGTELNVAKQIQASMLPSKFPAFPNDKRFDIYATMQPAKEVGGDFYDFFMIDENNLAVVVADVSGKGVPASLFMVIGKTLIKDHTNMSKDLGSIFSEVNNLLCESNSEELFITAFEAVINLETGNVKYVNAGHELPFIYNKKTGYKPFEMRPGFVLAGMENIKYKFGEFNIEKGDKIFQYTDGVTEATSIINELYGMERLEKALNDNCKKNQNKLLISIKNDIDSFVGEAPQFDDITMLGFEYFGKD